jgi:hypothetical protein
MSSRSGPRTGSPRSPALPPTAPRRGGHPRPLRDAGLDGAAGGLPVDAGDRHGRSGQQSPADPRANRKAGCHGIPDERAPDGAEHPGMRHQRRARGLPQLAQSGPRGGSRPGMECGPPDPARMESAHACYADIPVRRGRVDPAAVDHRHQPGCLVAGPHADSTDPRSEFDRSESLFLIVQDAFLTETAQFADVVLPAALWGEKTGCFTNADRTVHLSRKAVDPPGEARSDLDILLDYARRMDFRDKDGAPLVKWTDPEGAFDGWRACSRGRPCDYSGLTYAKLSQGSGIQWPCNEQYPGGGSGCMATACSRRAPTSANCTGTTLPPGRRPHGDRAPERGARRRVVLRGGRPRGPGRRGSWSSASSRPPAS